jgi:hypothetical protein
VSGFLGALAQRAIGTAPFLSPRPVSRYEPVWGPPVNEGEDLLEEGHEVDAPAQAPDLPATADEPTSKPGGLGAGTSLPAPVAADVVASYRQDHPDPARPEVQIRPPVADSARAPRRVAVRAEGRGEATTATAGATDQPRQATEDAREGRRVPPRPIEHPPYQAGSPWSDRERRSEAPGEIVVRIGRIDVRAVHASTVAPAAEVPTERSRLPRPTLEDHLRARDAGLR